MNINMSPGTFDTSAVCTVGGAAGGAAGGGGVLGCCIWAEEVLCKPELLLTGINPLTGGVTPCEILGPVVGTIGDGTGPSETGPGGPGW